MEKWFQDIAKKYNIPVEMVKAIVCDLDLYLSKVRNVPCVFNMN